MSKSVNTVITVNMTWQTCLEALLVVGFMGWQPELSPDGLDPSGHHFSHLEADIVPDVVFADAGVGCQAAERRIFIKWYHLL